MSERFLLIAPLGDKGIPQIVRFRDGGSVTATAIVEGWQRDYRNAPCKWKLAEGNGWVGAMIEMASFNVKGR